ncbi:MAG TPA: maleylpyruvate isomerase family mycothiol-dependent enzyme, partial [Micromonosporaceae bacterium]|jgi:maleylpyruvate isomerase|nr:maleylpyruvate isomerase family mycothiol-dependent enzyme [Micromonosporaceae bacterium]
MADPHSVLAEVSLATKRLVASCQNLTDADVKAPSLLPGWSRGHVLAHISRHADSMVNLLTWARTGVVTPMYPHRQARAEGIEAGAPRPLAEQIADLEASTRRFEEAAASLPETAWDAEVRGGGGQMAAREVPFIRLREVEVHHVDLDAGYTPGQWPTRFSDRLLAEVADDFGRRAGLSPVRLRSQNLDTVIGIGDPDLTVSGDSQMLLAWLLGRSDGTGLVVTPPSPLPLVPAWK